MKTRALELTLAATLAAVALAGCGGKSTVAPTGGNSETLAITTALTATPGLVSDDLVDSPSSTPLSATRTRTGGLSIESEVMPRFFWRTIVSAVPRFTIVFADTDSTGRPRQADVLVSRRLLGSFNIIKNTSGDVAVLDSANIVRKPLDDQWLRYLRLRRFVLPGEANVWRVVAASGVKLTSKNATSNIVSVRVQTSNTDTTLTDPLAFFAREHCLQVSVGDSLRLTATTSRTDDIVLAYWHDHRERFRNNGDGTYSFTLHPLDTSGLRFFGVNALSNGTLFDDQAPYDSMAWLFHCFIGQPPPQPYFE